MDSQHRHELQQNDLRKITNQAIPFLEQYGLQLAIGVALAAVIAIGGIWWYSANSESSADSWTQLDHALHKPNASADDFSVVTDKHPGSTAAAWAKLKTAEDHLKSGLQAAFTDREASLADLKKAQEAFQKLEGGGAGITPDIRERALFGLARCLETVSDGKTEDAVKVYSRLVTDFPESMFKGVAQDRIKSLETPAAKEFYAWFHTQKPQPKDPHPFPVTKPQGDAAEGADESMDLTDPVVEPPQSGDKPSEETDAAKPDEKPSDEKPSDEKPADEKPAEAKPSEDKPADEKPSESSGSSESP